MFVYVILHLLRMKFGLDVYVTENVVLHLREYFEDVTDFPVAEETLCGFNKFWKEFGRSQRREIDLYARNKILERKNETSDFFQPKKEDNLISVLHSNEANRVKVKIDDSFLSLTSFLSLLLLFIIILSQL